MWKEVGGGMNDVMVLRSVWFQLAVMNARRRRDEGCGNGHLEVDGRRGDVGECEKKVMMNE